jgi:phytoene/squalene synthetase
MTARRDQAEMMPATTESHSARYFALLYSPPSQRLVLEALFGIEREVSESLRPGVDHHVAHSRLQWWREECERAAGGRPVHPLTRALVDALRGVSMPGADASSNVEQAGTRSTLPPLAGLTGFVDVAVWDLAGATFETRRELTAYCERWAAAMIEPLAARAAGNGTGGNGTGGGGTGGGGTDGDGIGGTLSGRAGGALGDAERSNWRALGAAMREIEMLVDLAREAHYGRLRVPLDELETAKVDPTTLAKPPWPGGVAELLRIRHQFLRTELARTLDGVDREQQVTLRGLLVWVALVWRSSYRAERALPGSLLPRRFDAIADAWFAWRIARRATIGQFKLN